VIWVGGCGTGEKRHAFEHCPGFYLRDSISWGEDCLTIDGIRTPGMVAASAHWKYNKGHSIGNPPPPRLMEAVEFWEMETRARSALQMQKHNEDMEKQRKSSELKARYPNANYVASG